MPKLSKPLVSIILPTYNRDSFLPGAFSAIKDQSFSDWELIIVDDGSTDNTQEVVDNFSQQFSQDVKYIYQDNRGPAAARNTGLEYAKGKYIAFYDSDDLWLPHHLEKCVEALEKNSDVDWVFGACRLVEYPSGRVVNPNHFYEPDGTPRMMLKLKVERRGDLFIIEDHRSALRCAILGDLSAGPQHSLIRSTLFKKFKFNEKYKIGEDLLLVLECLKYGYTFAYYRDIHVIYRIHTHNISLVAKQKSLDEKIINSLEFVRALLEAKQFLNLREKRVLFSRASNIYFWNIGYPFLEYKNYAQALFYFNKGIKIYPFSLRLWKTYFSAIIKWIYHKIRNENFTC